MRFQKGHTGRPKGAKNKAHVLVEAACRALIETPEYQTQFLSRLKNGTLPPALEAMTWHYAYGKPIERQEHSGPGGGPIPYMWAE